MDESQYEYILESEQPEYNHISDFNGFNVSRIQRYNVKI